MVIIFSLSSSMEQSMEPPTAYTTELNISPKDKPQHVSCVFDSNLIAL